MIENLEPYIDINLIEKYMNETTEARAIEQWLLQGPILEEKQ